MPPALGPPSDTTDLGAKCARPGTVERLCAIVMGRLESQGAPSEALIRVIPDLVAVAMGGAMTQAAGRLATLVPSSDAVSGSARVWGQSRRASLHDAVLCNAFAAHVLDFDDDETELAMAHMSVTLVTAALTLCDALPTPVTGRRLFSACAAGYDVALALGTMANPGMYRRGWHATSVLGPFAAAAACGALLELDTRQMASALGLAASLSGGVRGAFGGEGKPLQVAQAAASGLMAAQLAQQGFHAPAEALEGPRGFLGLHGAAEMSVPTPIGFPPPGFVTKAYPTCTATHAAIAAALDAAAELQADALIDRIDCLVDPFVPSILLQGVPETPDEARFNMAYCLARAVLDRRLGPDAFRPEALHDPQIQMLMQRVRVGVATDLPKGPSGVATGAHVVLYLPDGEAIRRTRLAAPGSAEAPLSDSERLAKFSLCLKPFCPPDIAARHFLALLDLAEAPDVRTVLAPLLDLSPRTLPAQGLTE